MRVWSSRQAPRRISSRTAASSTVACCRVPGSAGSRSPAATPARNGSTQRGRAEPFSHDLTADGELRLRGNGLPLHLLVPEHVPAHPVDVTRTASTAATAMRLDITDGSACSMVSHPGSIQRIRSPLQPSGVHHDRSGRADRDAAGDRLPGRSEECGNARPAHRLRPRSRRFPRFRRVAAPSRRRRSHTARSGSARRTSSRASAEPAPRFNAPGVIAAAATAPTGAAVGSASRG